ncbi:hypothetical protein MNBD_GAMMA26-2299 [hydrothermal vent metagenome]|uniref:Uncharacterized protein n=1 Tax=hydrothermal vent metagenome TaxID=652676 RepID=A0A3B1ASZ5_9ZZZZ
MNEHKENRLVRYSVNHPRVVIAAMTLSTLLLIMLAILPLLFISNGLENIHFQR